MIAAYRETDRTRGQQLMQRLIDSVSHGVPAALSEVLTLGRTLKKRAVDVLAYFDRPGTSNGPPTTPWILKSRLSVSLIFKRFANSSNFIGRIIIRVLDETVSDL